MSYPQDSPSKGKENKQLPGSSSAMSSTVDAAIVAVASVQLDDPKLHAIGSHIGITQPQPKGSIPSCHRRRRSHRGSQSRADVFHQDKITPQPNGFSEPPGENLSSSASTLPLPPSSLSHQHAFKDVLRPPLSGSNVSDNIREAVDVDGVEKRDHKTIVAYNPAQSSSSSSSHNRGLILPPIPHPDPYYPRRLPMPSDANTSSRGPELAPPEPEPEPKTIQTTFVDVPAHTAKCDLCNNRNVTGMSRCLSCGWQSCHKCTERTGYTRSHRAGGDLHEAPIDASQLEFKVPKSRPRQRKRRQMRINAVAQRVCGHDGRGGNENMKVDDGRIDPSRSIARDRGTRHATQIEPSLPQRGRSEVGAMNQASQVDIGRARRGGARSERPNTTQAEPSQHRRSRGRDERVSGGTLTGPSQPRLSGNRAEETDEVSQLQSRQSRRHRARDDKTNCAFPADPRQTRRSRAKEQETSGVSIRSLSRFSRARKRIEQDPSFHRYTDLTSRSNMTRPTARAGSTHLATSTQLHPGPAVPAVDHALENTRGTDSGLGCAEALYAFSNEALATPGDDSVDDASNHGSDFSRVHRFAMEQVRLAVERHKRKISKSDVGNFDVRGC
ncbi:hypothetical protein BO70DRAFT_408351 [Aspergillus heteromorphus CBS 117.55]|uniref:Uncharacterized protein n=1 Tax=Aspergillus heteromorphus CBS 117.55 TaxID=1448321 RepID=A0A317W284_9EURO|nr:uncharacterized protein BO70DRAFT_408351 [Aspergillus heteromorphus CBS 117.55]PWY78290.1 hypothetical protein BO70DRAFT_408351 [Aspergillus heteromorphus CBS 117.55]